MGLFDLYAFISFVIVVFSTSSPRTEKYLKMITFPCNFDVFQKAESGIINRDRSATQSCDVNCESFPLRSPTKIALGPGDRSGLSTVTCWTLWAGISVSASRLFLL